MNPSRKLSVWLCAFAAALPTCSANTWPVQDPAAPTAAQAAPIAAVAQIGITVSDLDRAVAFFTEVLTFEKVDESKASGDSLGELQGLPSPVARTARLKLGDDYLELTEYDAPKGRDFPRDSRSHDRWFQHVAIIVSDVDRAHARLMERGVQPASRNGPQRLPDWNRAAAGIKAFYFRDEDGHFLEILQFPSGKGDPKWHVPTDRLFLGIDHTAIVVADTEASLRFYRDLLGFQVVGGSENYGREQADLNNVPGAHLRITTLRAPAGPAIEFLEYLHPRDGRPYPADVRTNDLLHWQTTLVVRDASGVAEQLRHAGTRFVSPDVVEFSRPQSDFRKAVIVRDPDGHAMRIVEE
ncbi:MAG: glyoxalase [Phycisphaerales bacterium]|nr:MAG: glyoxalase [Phycisphaerales bacterium]